MQSLVPHRSKEVSEDVDFILIGAGILNFGPKFENLL